MVTEQLSALLRQIPAVDEVLNRKSIREKEQTIPRKIVVDTIREVLENMRRQVRAGELTSISDEEIESGVLDRLEKRWRPSLCRVINATGVVLHTNLGRAVLSKAAQEAVQAVIMGYSNLELDLETGSRGSRYDHVAQLLVELTGAEAALVVNNNAAAVMLALNTLAKGKEAIVSRGQMVEIGGSFRVPAVMEASGARLVEVGTTNKTYARDYEGAISPETAVLLKVHTSNFRVVGFTHQASTAELVELGQKYGIPVLEDLGSGFLVDLREKGIGDEPTVQESVLAGADVVTFSGDKLLGGPQAGIIVGKKKYIDAIKKNNLTRALRVDKMTLAALEATLRQYYDQDKVIQNIPALRQLTMTASEIESRSRELAGKLKDILIDKAHVIVEGGFSEVGGGALPTTQLPTQLVVVRPKEVTAETIAVRLRHGRPPVIARIHENRILLDVRTILQEDLDDLVHSIWEAMT